MNVYSIFNVHRAVDFLSEKELPKWYAAKRAKTKHEMKNFFIFFIFSPKKKKPSVLHEQMAIINFDYIVKKHEKAAPTGEDRGRS